MFRIPSKFQSHSFKKSFTLIEFMVVFAVMMILFALVFIDYKKVQKTLALERAANKLAQDIRTAQSMAMSASAKNPCDEPHNFTYTFGVSVSNKVTCRTDRPEPCRYRYFLFIDCNKNDTYQWQPDEHDPTLETPDMPLVEIVQPSGQKDIAFKPPYPIIIFDGQPAVAPLSIVLRLRDDTSRQKTVIVYPSGLIEVR